GIAQVSGSLTGIVSDPSGAAIPGASVELKNTQINLKRQTSTDSAGRYHFVGLPAATYELSVQSNGFKVFKKAVNVGSSPVTANVTLDVGNVSETVEVSAQASSVNASSASTRRQRIPGSGVRDRKFQFNTEQYDNWRENEFLDVRRNPLSTFSADVDTASYSNVRR